MVKTREKEGIVISFSGGRTSALMTIELLKQYPDAVVIFMNTGKENEATLEFVNKVDSLIGGKVVWLEYNPDSTIWFNVVSYETASRNGEPFSSLIKKRNYLPNRVARFCTQDLKIRPMKKYCQRVLGWKYWSNMVGIRYDEPLRWAKSKSVEKGEVFDVVHPLVSWKITKKDVLSYWEKMPFDLELEEFEGNCDVCFLKGKMKKQKIARKSPEKFNWWINQENRYKSRFVKDYTYKQIKHYVLNSPEFDFDDSIQCFCTSD